MFLNMAMTKIHCHTRHILSFLNCVLGNVELSATYDYFRSTEVEKCFWRVLLSHVMVRMKCNPPPTHKR